MLRTLLAVAALGIAARSIAESRLKPDFTGKVVVITGGSRGLGFVLAREFLAAGAYVAVCARDRGELDRARSMLGQQTRCLLSVCDVTDRTQVGRWLDEVEAAFGDIDVLVNNAGIISLVPIRHATEEDFQKSMDTMFWGAVHPTFAVLPQMIERGEGCIVNITSIAGKVPAPHVLPYSAAKAALVAFSEGLAAEVSPTGVRVVTAVPGFMRTGSDLHIELKGGWRRDFLRWDVAASMPIVSIDAERVARRLVRAVARGEREVMFTLPTHVLARLHSFAPGLSVGMLGQVARLLPRDRVADRESLEAMELIARPHSPLLDAMSSWNRRASERFNQVPTA